MQTFMQDHSSLIVTPTIGRVDYLSNQNLSTLISTSIGVEKTEMKRFASEHTVRVRTND